MTLRLEAFKKASSSIVEIEEGILTLWMFVTPLKASSAILFIEYDVPLTLTLFGNVRLVVNWSGLPILKTVAVSVFSFTAKSMLVIFLFSPSKTKALV